MICPRKVLALASVAVLGFVLAKAAPPPSNQQTPQAPQPPPSSQDSTPRNPQVAGPGIRVTAEQVVVPVTVKDSSGNLVGDLTEDEFRVFEDDVEQHIVYFSADATPLSAVVVVDDGMKLKTAQQLQKTLVSIAGAFSASDEVAVGKFDEFYTPVLDFTTDNDGLITALKSMDITTTSTFATGSGPQPPVPSAGNQAGPGNIAVSATPGPGPRTKSIDDAVHAAAEMLRTRDRGRRKMIVLVTDGVNSRYSKFSHEETLKLLLSSDISVYAIGLGSSVILRGTTAPSHYAHATGGDIYYVARATELARFYAQVSEQARHQYTLAYTPRGTDRGKDYHTIEVRIRRPGLKLLTRDGYYPIPRP